MINQHVTAGNPARSGNRRRAALRLGRRPGPRAGRLLVLLAAFVCAACGLVYELELVALGSYLLGDPVTQASVVLSVMVFAMGLGSLLAKRLTGRPAASFAAVECALALVGGLSALALYACFVWADRYDRAALVACALVIGILMGAEIPLLATLIQRLRRPTATDTGRAVADLFAADYVGALVGGLAFPFLILPQLGEAGGALLTGVVNALAGGAVVLWLHPEQYPWRLRALLWTACTTVLAVLGLAAAQTASFEQAARTALYGGPVRTAFQSRYDRVALTPNRLYLGGQPAACFDAAQARFERAFTALLAPLPPSPRILLIGDAAGLTARALLRRFPTLRQLTVLGRDPDLLRLARTDPTLTAANSHALDDPRVHAVIADPVAWLRSIRRAPYDAVLLDFPAPADEVLASEEFYGLLTRALPPDAPLLVHTTPTSLWPNAATLTALSLHPHAYRLPPTCTLPSTALLSSPHPPPASLPFPSHLPPPTTLLNPTAP